MPTRSRRKLTDYEPKRRNPITLGNDSNIDNDLKVIKVDSKNSILELSNNELKVRGTVDASAITVGGASVVTDLTETVALNDLSDVTYSSGDLTITSLDTIVASGDLTIDADGDIELNANGGDVAIKDDTGYHFKFDCNNTKFIIYDDTSALDYFSITVGASGATIITTVDDGAAIGHLIIRPDGHVEFDQCAVGFTRKEATFSLTGIVGSGGSDDTDIDFRGSNKYRLELTNDIAQMNLIFPNTSGNFVLVCNILGGGGGDHDVPAWKVWAYDETAASTADVMWAGGSVPAFTSGASTDIVSFYWDADEQQCYGVASLAFATP